MTSHSDPSEQGGGATPAPSPLDGKLPSSSAPDPASVRRAYGQPDRVSPASEQDADGSAEGTHDQAAEQAAPEQQAREAPVELLTREELEQALAETQVALSLAEAQRDEHLADLQRKAAELSNVLKREQRNAGVGRVEGRMEVMRSLLDVLDDFDRTMDAVAATEDERLRSGVALVHDKLAAALHAQGLVRTGEAGEPFDPNHHEAVQQVEAEDGPLDGPVVDQVFRPGYVVGERVLRAAMVVVRQ